MENWREITISENDESWKSGDNMKKLDDGYTKSDEEEVDNGPNKEKIRPKGESGSCNLETQGERELTLLGQ